MLLLVFNIFFFFDFLAWQSSFTTHFLQIKPFNLDCVRLTRLPSISLLSYLRSLDYSLWWWLQHMRSGGEFVFYYFLNLENISPYFNFHCPLYPRIPEINIQYLYRIFVIPRSADLCNHVHNISLCLSQRVHNLKYQIPFFSQTNCCPSDR